MDAHQDLLYLEFMKGGNLSDLIVKAFTAAAEFPNGVLWKIFFCRKRICSPGPVLNLADFLALIRQPVVRACLAMDCPPRMYLTEDTQEWVWDSETGGDITERLPDSRSSGYGLVHLDLDPKNGESSNLLLNHSR